MREEGKKEILEQRDCDFRRWRDTAVGAVALFDDAGGGG